MQVSNSLIYEEAAWLRARSLATTWLKSGGTNGSLADPGFDLRFTGSSRGIEKFAEIGILCQTGCDGLSVSGTVFEHWLAEATRFGLGWEFIFTGGGCVIDDLIR